MEISTPTAVFQETIKFCQTQKNGHEFRSPWDHQLLVELARSYARFSKPREGQRRKFRELHPYHPWEWYIYLHEWLNFYGKCR